MNSRFCAAPLVLLVVAIVGCTDSPASVLKAFEAPNKAGTSRHLTATYNGAPFNAEYVYAQYDTTSPGLAPSVWIMGVNGPDTLRFIVDPVMGPGTYPLGLSPWYIGEFDWLEATELYTTMDARASGTATLTIVQGNHLAGSFAAIAIKQFPSGPVIVNLTGTFDTPVP